MAFKDFMMLSCSPMSCALLNDAKIINFYTALSDSENHNVLVSDTQVNVVLNVYKSFNSTLCLNSPGGTLY